jgi:voltage-gated potassium channel
VTCIPQIVASAALITVTLVIQCGGMALLIRWGLTRFKNDSRALGTIRTTLLIVRITTIMIALHFMQILVWAAFFSRTSLKSWPSAFYFSVTSYSTVGYGDIVIRDKWQSLGPIEAITGVLMCGLSVSLLFAIVTRLVDREIQLSPELAALRKIISQPAVSAESRCERVHSDAR